MTGLSVALRDGELELLPLTEAHREGLRAACAADAEIWDIYPYSMLGAAFDPAFDAMFAVPLRLPFAIVAAGEVMGCTSYWHDVPNAVVEIGGSYLHPGLRGSGANRRLKRLMIEHAFATGIRRIEFRVDTRNTRSMAAVEKLGAKREGILRRNRVTWTGFIRDTAVFGLFPEDWA
jgi:RimJ/RimL family protein N-acetyltransferase